MAVLLSVAVFVMPVVIVESSVAVAMVVSVRGGICCDCCRGVILWGFSCSVCWGGLSGSRGVCLGEGDGCGVCLYDSGGHGVCWGSSRGFCQYAGRGVVCWGGVGSGGDSNIVSNAGIVGISCVSSLGGDDINDSGCVSDSRCSVSSGGKSYVSCVTVVVFRLFDGFYD